MPTLHRNTTRSFQPQRWLSSVSKLPLAFLRAKVFRQSPEIRSISVSVMIRKRHNRDEIHPGCWQPVLMARARN